LKDIPANILKQFDITPVRHMDEVLSCAIILEPGETLFKKPEEIVSPEAIPQHKGTLEPLRMN